MTLSEANKILQSITIYYKIFENIIIELDEDPKHINRERMVLIKVKMFLIKAKN